MRRVVKELLRTYLPIVLPLLLVERFWNLRLSNLLLAILIATEVFMMLNHQNGGSDSELVVALKDEEVTRNTALALAHLPKIGVEILAKYLMPKQGRLALMLLYSVLLTDNLVKITMGGEIVTGNVPALLETS